MELIIHLSQENVPLARAEAEALAGKRGKLIENLLFIEADPELLERRISYAHKIYRSLFGTTEKKLEERMESFDWKKHYSKDFKLELHDFGCKTERTARELADIIWRRLKAQGINPKANFKSPKTRIEFLFAPKRVFAALLIAEVSKDFLERKAHKKPALHPTSLNPKVARAMINLTGIKKGKLHDPFCGAGGILVEAAFMGFDVVGYDISSFMLKKAKENLKHYGIRDFSLNYCDATEIKERMDYVAADLPYGRNSKVNASLERIYSDFLNNARFRRAVLGFPDFVDYRKIIRRAKRKVLGEYTIYLHRSLSKKIVVIA